MSDTFLTYYLCRRIRDLKDTLKDTKIVHDKETDIFIRGGISELERMLKLIEKNGFLGWEDGI